LAFPVKTTPGHATVAGLGSRRLRQIGEDMGDASLHAQHDTKVALGTRNSEGSVPYNLSPVT